MKWKMIQLYRGGASLNALSRDFGLSTETVRRRLLEWKVPLRSHAEAVRVTRGGQRS